MSAAVTSFNFVAISLFSDSGALKLGAVLAEAMLCCNTNTASHGAASRIAGRGSGANPALRENACEMERALANP
jgi:hypothetical protein